MLPEFIFSVGNSMQDLSCDDFNFINGVNNATTTTAAKTDINSTSPQQQQLNQQSQQQSIIKNNGSNDDCSLLRGIKLEDVQNNGISNDNNGNCCELYTTKINETQTNEIIKTEVTATEQWPTVHTIFNCNEPQTTTNNQLQREQIQQLQLNRQTPTSFQQQQQQPQRHQHHQLLLQSSDDPLICHGANDDHSVELKNLLTVVSSNGQKTHHHQHQQHQQRQQQSHHHQHHQQKHQQQRLLVSTKKLPTTTQTSATLCQKRPQNGCSSLTKQQLKVKAGLMSAANQQQKLQEALNAASPQNVVFTKTKQKSKKKIQTTVSTNAPTINSTGNSALKLRFHHQALPPEYLSHYEATQRRLSQNIVTLQPQKNNTTSATATTTANAVTNNPNQNAVKVLHTAKLPPQKSSHENVRSWLQKIAEIQRVAQQQQQQQQNKQPQQPPSTTLKQTTTKTPSNHLQRTTTVEHDVNNNDKSCRMLVMRNKLQTTKTTSPVNGVPKHINPTLKSTPLMKTNRLVNYADLPYMGEITLNNSKPRRGRKPKKADICHLIYKNYGNTIFAKSTENNAVETQLSTDLKTKVTTDDQPLNLCMRDY